LEAGVKFTSKPMSYLPDVWYVTYPNIK